MRDLFSRLTLSEEGSEGGSGGGGGEATPPQTETGARPLPSNRARQEIYDRADSSTEKGNITPQPSSEPEKKVEGAPEGAATPEESAPKPEVKEKKGKELTPEQIAEKRVKDAQATLTRKAQEAAEERQKREAAEAKLKLAEKYVDFDKLTEYDKSQEAERANRPVTHAELEARERERQAAANQPAAGVVDEAAREKYMADYYVKHPHMKQVVEDGLAYGVFLKTAESLGPDATLDEIGDKVAEHFKTAQAERERKVAEQLNTKRTALSAGASPRAAGSPSGGDDEGPEVDDPKAEYAHRRAMRSRVLSPKL